MRDAWARSEEVYILVYWLRRWRGLSHERICRLGRRMDRYPGLRERIRRLCYREYMEQA